MRHSSCRRGTGSCSAGTRNSNVICLEHKIIFLSIVSSLKCLKLIHKEWQTEQLQSNFWRCPRLKTASVLPGWAYWSTELVRSLRSLSTCHAGYCCGSQRHFRAVLNLIGLEFPISTKKRILTTHVPFPLVLVHCTYRPYPDLSRSHSLVWVGTARASQEFYARVWNSPLPL